MTKHAYLYKKRQKISQYWQEVCFNLTYSLFNHITHPTIGTFVTLSSPSGRCIMAMVQFWVLQGPCVNVSRYTHHNFRLGHTTFIPLIRRPSLKIDQLITSLKVDQTHPEMAVKQLDRYHNNYCINCCYKQKYCRLQNAILLEDF